jgi:putative ABC transport system permease protein
MKAQGDPRALANPVRQTIRELDANLPVAAVRTMDEVVAATLSAPRFTGMLLGVFAALALVLSAIGIYGVLSYVVSRRTREIGIRVAIGAGRAQVLRLVLGSGVGLALVGIVIGLAAAASLSRLMTTLLHDVQPGDPATYAAVAGALTVVAIAASLIPAWRATRVDPVRALKAE